MTKILKLHNNLLTEFTLLIAAAFSIIYGNIDIFMLILSITIHELGHVIAAIIVGAKTENFAIHGFGVEITFPGKSPTAKKMLLISSGGPIVSLILALAGLYFNNFMLFSVNISIAVINLIPACPLDGGNILQSILSGLVTRKKLWKLMTFLGKFFGTVLSILGILVLFVSGFNISLIYMGLFIFFSAGRTYNPVAEIFSTEYPKIEKNTIFAIDSSMSPLEAAENMPANSIGAIKDKSGKILSFVTPLYLYNQEINKSRHIK